MVTMDNFDSSSFDIYDINLVQKEVGGGVKDKDGYTEYFFLCKRKKTCIKGQDDERFASYLNEFQNILKECRKNKAKS